MMFEGISKRIKKKKKLKTVEAELSSSKQEPSLATQPISNVDHKPAKAKKPDLGSWGLLTGTYDPLPDDADENNKS